MKIVSLLLTILPLISTLFLFTFLSATALSQEHTHFGLLPNTKARFGKGRIHQVKYFPDGNRLAVATSIGVWIYDVQTGEPLDLLTEHTAPVKSIEFSLDGATLASGSEDKTIRLWDTSTGKLKSTCLEHEDEVVLLAFCPSGKSLASTSGSSDIQIWDVQTGNVLKTFEAGVTPIYSITFSLDGTMLLIIGNTEDYDSRIEYWDTQTGEHIKNVLIESKFKAAAMSPNCKILACVDYYPLQFYDVETGKHLRSVEKRLGELNSIQFSSDRRTLITGGRWGTVDIWDVNTAKNLRSMLHKKDDDVVSVTYSPDEQTIASGGEDGTVKFWDVATGKLTKTITGHISSEIYSAAYSPDDHTLACGSEDKLFTWNARTGELLKTSTDPNREVYSIKYSSDGKIISTVGLSTRSHITNSHKARLWNVKTGRFLGSFAGHFSIAFSPDGTILATGGRFSQVCLWEIRRGELYLIGDRLATFTEHTENVTSVAFSPDGKVLASGSQDKTIQIWDMDTRTHLKTFTGHDEGVTDVVFSPDGTTLASGSEDGTIRLWNVNSDGLVLPPIEGAGHITSLDYSPDGGILASGTEDGNAIHIWEAKTGEKLHTFTGHTQRVNDVVFSTDGTTLVSVSDDGTVLLWDLSTLASD
ncbi:MAG: WD40 repeat domain-containing protein [Candidatus Poribacteria bacterium]|nr:WD40 repeat domain-containing protein [Candidatus Poribacteria bacterium]